LQASTRKTILTALVLAAGLVTTVLIYKLKTPPAAKPIPEVIAPIVQAVERTPAPQALSVLTQGTVQPRREIDLVTQVSGKIVEVSDNFADGAFVRQQHLLIKIEDHDYRYALIRAEAQLADAEQLLATEKGRARQAKREWRNLGNAEANDLFLRKPQLAAANAAVAAARADRDQARLNVQRTEIVAPFDGRIRETRVDLGQFVNAGTALARFYATDKVELRLPLTDKQVALLDLPLYSQNSADQLAATVDIETVYGDQRWHWQGEIVRVDASLDMQSRLTYAVAEIAQPFVVAEDGQSNRPPLMIGQFALAAIQGRQLDNVVAIPRAALQPGNSLWLVNDRQQLQQQTVKVLQANADIAYVQFENNQPVTIMVSQLTVAVDGMVVNPELMVGEER
jgi:RND family efflux transporter MFP subunit